STDLTLPLMFTSEGGHVCTAWVLNPNHSNDENHSNDTITDDFHVISAIDVNTILLCPNPANGVLHLIVQNPSAADLNLKICNDIGQVMQQHYITLSTNSSGDIDLSNLAAGIYFLYATIGFDRKTEKLMVMHP